jgi:hypothetical protein
MALLGTPQALSQPEEMSMAEHDVMTESGRPRPPEQTESSGKAGAARAAASDVSDSARQVAGDVKHEAGKQARAVGSEMTDQARQLFDTTRAELKDQAAARTERLAGGLRNLSDQVRALADGRPTEAGQLRDLAGEAEERLQGFARRLDEGGIDGLLSDIGQFARRRPLVFLAGCAGAGFLIGRVVRTTRAASGDGDGYRGYRTTPAMTTSYPAASLGTVAPSEVSAPIAGQGLGTVGGAGSSGLPGDLE